jgi:hypothetical protein
MRQRPFGQGRAAPEQQRRSQGGHDAMVGSVRLSSQHFWSDRDVLGGFSTAKNLDHFSNYQIIVIPNPTKIVSGLSLIQLGGLVSANTGIS